MLREKKQKKTTTLKHSICIANSLVSFFGDVTSGGCFAFCRVFFFLLLNFCFSLSGDDLQLAVGRWKSSWGVTSKSFPRSHQKGLSIFLQIRCLHQALHKDGNISKNQAVLFTLFISAGPFGVFRSPPTIFLLPSRGRTI